MAMETAEAAAPATSPAEGAKVDEAQAGGAEAGEKASTTEPTAPDVPAAAAAADPEKAATSAAATTGAGTGAAASTAEAEGAAAAAAEPGAASVEEETPKPKFENGSKVQCRWDDDTQHICEILDIRQGKDKGKVIIQYYVHYVDYDRRLDDWVNADRLSDPKQQLALVRQNSADTGEKATGFLTRNQRRRMEESMVGEGHAHEPIGEGLANSIQAQMEKEHFENTKVKNIRCIQLGKYEIDCWYFSPYPEGYSQDKLYICEYSLKYFKNWKTWARHKQNPTNEACRLRRPPGLEIYNDGLIRVFEVCRAAPHLVSETHFVWAVPAF